MHFELSDDQTAIRSSLRRTLKDKAPVVVMRHAFESRHAGDAEVWRAIADLGCLGLTVSEAQGGAGLGWIEVGLAALEAGRVLAPVPLSSAAVAVHLLAESGKGRLLDRWLGPALAGETIGCIALIEGEDPFASPITRLDGECLTGRKRAVSGAKMADFAIVSCVDKQGEPRFALVDLSAPGVRREEEVTLDGSRGHATLVFEGAQAELLTNSGTERVAWALDAAAILLAHEQLGGAERCLEMAVAYAKERRAFGRAIGSFQIVKHKLVTMFVKVELARSHVSYAVWALASNAPDRGLAAASARVSGGAAFTFAAQEAIQVHGALGFSWEHDLHLFLRRARVLALELGAAAQWKDRLVDHLDVHFAAEGDHGL